jgi:hypothetical protein
MKLGVFFAAALVVVALEPRSSVAQSKPKPIPISVYKTASCGCCRLWVDHMKSNGFDPKVQDVENIGALKLKLGVREPIASCHTAEVGGYVIEGHVPADVVQRLLKERPKVAGLAVPGMPAGSPGMEVPGGRKDAYAVLTFTSDGKTAVYERK